MNNKLNFGQRMKELKRQKERALKDKQLLDSFPPVTPENQPGTSVYVYKPIIGPDGTVTQVPTRLPNHIEKAIQRVREQSQGL